LLMADTPALASKFQVSTDSTAGARSGMQWRAQPGGSSLIRGCSECSSSLAYRV